MTPEAQTQTGDPAAISNIPQAFSLDNMNTVELPSNISELNTSEFVLDDESQVRRFPPDQKKLMDLVHDIVRQGQLYPILYRVVGGKNIVVDGATRVRAIAYINAEKLTKTKLKVKALLLDLSDVEAFAAGAAANIKRSEMSPIDHARVVRTLVNQFGMTKADVAKVLSRSAPWVTEISQMADLRPAIQKKIHEGKIGYTTARELVQMSEDEQDEFLADLEKSGGEGKSKRGKGKTREMARAKRRAKNQAKGGGESDTRASLTMREVREGLENLAGIGKEAAAAKKDKTEYECKYSKTVQTVAAAVLRFLDGKLGEKALANKIDAA